MERKLSEEELGNVVGGINMYNIGNTKLFEKFVDVVVGKTMEKRFEKIRSKEKTSAKN